MADVLNPFTESFGDSDGVSESILTIDLPILKDKDVFRPGIADDQKIGFFSLDRSTQTDCSDIIEIKQLTDNVGQLMDDATSMRRDINFAQSVMQADFETKLQQKSIELYVRVNDKISELEKMHEDRVATVRRAFKQQLSDALARMQSLYNRDFEKRMDRERVKTEMSQSKWEKKAKELQVMLQRNESVIALLKEQIQDYQDQEPGKVFSWTDDETATKSQSHASPRQTVIMKSPSPDYALEEEASELREQVLGLEEKISSLEDACATKEDNIQHLGTEVDNLKDQLEREKIMVEQLQHEKEEITNSNEQDQAANRRKDMELENATLAMERDTEDRIRQIKQQALEEARREMDSMQSGNNEKLKQLMEEKKMVEQLLAKERAKDNARSADQIELEHLKRNEQRMISEIAKLKKEIERVHKTWERKFSILQQSLHALKNESFLRQTMQRQAAQLHQAAISYAYDAPMGIAPTGQKTNHSLPAPSKRPLPEISTKAPRSKSPADYISYTVSAPSGRATTVFSTDENQVMSEDEQDIPSDVQPLPSPPSRNMTEFSESRPSTVKSSHVVVLPSTTDIQ